MWACASRSVRPTRKHPLGYGKTSYFWSFVVALMLFSVGGLFSIYEGWHKLHATEPLNRPWIALLVLGVSIVLESGSLAGCLREINKLRGDKPFMQVAGRHAQCRTGRGAGRGHCRAGGTGAGHGLRRAGGGDRQSGVRCRRLHRHRRGADLRVHLHRRAHQGADHRAFGRGRPARWPSMPRSRRSRRSWSCSMRSRCNWDRR